MNSRSDPWKSKRLPGQAGVPLLVLTVRQRDCRYLSTKTSPWDGYAPHEEAEKIGFIFPSLPCAVKYKRSHNILAISRLQLYAVRTPGSCQKHNILNYFPSWKETLFLPSHCRTLFLTLKIKYREIHVLPWVNIALTQTTLYS